ncbi:MAG: cysteine hydrolase family protein, partial [Sphingomonas sp.]
VQKEYFPEGKLALTGMEAALESIEALIAYFRASHHPIVFVQHVALDPDPEAPFAADTTGTQLHDKLQPEPLDVLVAKSFPNAFFQSWLQSTLQVYGVTELVIAGAMTQTCIDSTARSALDFGYPVTVASDACVAGALEWEGKAISAAQVQKTFLAALAMLMPVKKVAEITASEPDPEAPAAESDPAP